MTEPNEEPNPDPEDQPTESTHDGAGESHDVDSNADQRSDEKPAQGLDTEKNRLAEDDPERDGDESPARHTSLRCLALIARHHSVDINAERLIHDYSLEDEEPSLKRIQRIAKDSGFKSKHVRLNWHQLCKMGQAFPAMAQLKNGNYVILVGMRQHQLDDGDVVDQIAIFDPLAFSAVNLALLAPVRAVSDPEKKAEIISRPAIEIDTNQKLVSISIIYSFPTYLRICL